MDINILSEEQCAQLRALIGEAENIVITCHMNPDGDAIGSSLALAEYLRSLGKEPTVMVPDRFPDYLMWLPNSERIIRYDKHQDKADLLLKIADLVFCLDYNVPGRAGGMADALVASPAKRVLIDHHLDPNVPAVLTVSHPELSSTSELVFRIVWQMGAFGQMTKHFAVPVYCGMMTDTGGFTYNSNDPAVFFIVSQLLTKQINKDKIYRNVFHNFSENRLRLMGYVMYEKLVVDAERHVSFYVLTRDDQKRFQFMKGDAEGLVNMPLQIKGMRLSVSLREDTEKDFTVWVSLRSVDTFPCNKMAEEFFNGGGHLNAAGGRLDCSVDEAVDVVRQAILKYEDLLK